MEKFYEKYASDIDCPICCNGEAQEGAVLRVEGNEIANYKAKSSRFLGRESISLDKGELTLEEVSEQEAFGQI